MQPFEHDDRSGLIFPHGSGEVRELAFDGKEISLKKDAEGNEVGQPRTTQKRSGVPYQSKKRKEERNTTSKECQTGGAFLTKPISILSPCCRLEHLKRNF